MKVVLFCGGLGMRMREYSEALPKPMVPVGYRPILWHVMRYYAHYGHTDFILCLGYRGDTIKKYFLEYDECVSNDFVLSQGGKGIELLNSDIQDWRITFVDTGLTSNIGQRLKAVQKHLAGEEIFLANYTDCLSDVDLSAVVDTLRRTDGVACFLSVRPNATFHLVEADRDGRVRQIDHIRRTAARINGGFFVFRREIFDYFQDGEELVEGPFHRLIAAGKLLTYQHDGYWACMDTFKEKQELDDIIARGAPPWAVWNGVS
jgi:glucose-1-phosphate cytidylyltransferase